MERSRVHKIELDLFDWEGGGKSYRVTLTVNEAKLDGSIGRAIARHDGRTELAGGGIVVEAREIK